MDEFVKATLAYHQLKLCIILQHRMLALLHFAKLHILIQY